MNHSLNRVSMADVAKAAGVSSTTVSQILNNKDNASESTRSRVIQVIKKLSYQPNADARRLRMGSAGLGHARRTSTIMFLTYGKGQYATQLMFETDYLAGILQATEASGYTLAIGRIGGNESLARLISQANYDGIIFATPDAEIIRNINKSCPSILVGSFISNSGLNCVLPDNQDGIRQVVEHLYKLGHRSVGFMSGNPDHPCYRERFKGYKSAIADLGLAYDEALVHWGMDLDAYFRRARLPTAIVCSNDSMASRVMKALREKGINVPSGMSVVGFDDLELADYSWPPLTTVSVPRQEIGRVAAVHLIEAIEGKFTGPVKIVLPVTLHVRESTARPGHALIPGRKQ